MKGQNICTDTRLYVPCMSVVFPSCHMAHGCKRHARAWLTRAIDELRNMKSVSLWKQGYAGTDDLASLETPVHIIVCILKKTWIKPLNQLEKIEKLPSKNPIWTKNISLIYIFFWPYLPHSGQPVSSWASVSLSRLTYFEVPLEDWIFVPISSLWCPFFNLLYLHHTAQTIVSQYSPCIRNKHMFPI